MDAGDGESIFLGLLIEPPVVDAQAELGRVAWGSLLGDNNYGGRVRALRRADYARFEEALYLSLEPLEGLIRDGAELTLEGGGLGYRSRVLGEGSDRDRSRPGRRRRSGREGHAQGVCAPGGKLRLVEG